MKKTVLITVFIFISFALVLFGENCYAELSVSISNCYSDPNDTNTAVGRSGSLLKGFSFDEALGDAIKNLPPDRRLVYPDMQSIIKVIGICFVSGGIAGDHALIVKISR